MITYTKIRKDLFTICVGTLLPCYLQWLGNWLYFFFFKPFYWTLSCKFVEELILNWVEDVWSWNSELQVEDFCPRKIEVIDEFGYWKVVIIANSLDILRRSAWAKSLLMAILEAQGKGETQQHGQKRVGKWIENSLSSSGRNNGSQTHEINKWALKG